MPKMSTFRKDQPAFDLRAAREARDLTQVQVAEMFFTTQVSIARYERDGNLPPLHRAYWELYWKGRVVRKPKRAAATTGKNTGRRRTAAGSAAAVAAPK